MKRFIKRTALAAILSTGLALGGVATAEHSALSETVPSGLYQMDVSHGYVTFSYSHLGLSNPQISFQKVEAYIKLDADDATASVVDVKIAADSIDSDVGIFNDHLNSANWLDTANHPEIIFKSTGLTQDSQDHTKGTMTGNLTIKGITKPVTLDVTMLGAVAEHPVKKVATVGVNATTTVLRSDFDLGAYAPAVSDKVTITISGEFNKVDPAAHGS